MQGAYDLWLFFFITTFSSDYALLVGQSSYKVTLNPKNPGNWRWWSHDGNYKKNPRLQVYNVPLLFFKFKELCVQCHKHERAPKPNPPCCAVSINCLSYISPFQYNNCWNWFAKEGTFLSRSFFNFFMVTCYFSYNWCLPNRVICKVLWPVLA